MKKPKIDLQEQAFVESALAAATRAQRWARARVIVTLLVAVSAAMWLASRPASPELGMECTVVIMVGAMLGVATAKLRSLITRNTVVVLQAIAAQSVQSDSASSPSGRHRAEDDISGQALL